MNTFNALGTPMRPLQYLEWNWDHDGSMDFNLEGHEDTTTAVDDTLAYGPYKGLTLVQLQSVQKEIQKRTEEQRVEHAKELQKLQEHSEEQRVEHAKELQRELQKQSEEQRVEYAKKLQRELKKYREEQQVEQTKEIQRKLQKHIEKRRAKHARELQAKEQGIANHLQRAVDIQAEATTILRTILHVDVVNEIFTHPRIDPHLDEWDATNTKQQ